jgi:hypothetical protein
VNRNPPTGGCDMEHYGRDRRRLDSGRSRGSGARQHLGARVAAVDRIRSSLGNRPSASVIACPAGAAGLVVGPAPWRRVGLRSTSAATRPSPRRFANPVIPSEVVIPEHLAGGLNPVEHGEAEFQCRVVEVQFRRLELPDLRARTNEDAVVGVRAREEAVSVMERVAVVGSERRTPLSLAKDRLLTRI